MSNQLLDLTPLAGFYGFAMVVASPGSASLKMVVCGASQHNGLCFLINLQKTIKLGLTRGVNNAR